MRIHETDAVKRLMANPELLARAKAAGISMERLKSTVCSTVMRDYAKAELMHTGTLWHGTGAAWADIAKRGILPRGGDGCDAWFARESGRGIITAVNNVTGEERDADDRRAVFLSPFNDSAACFAYCAAQVTGNVPLLCKILIPSPMRAKLEPDPCSGDAFMFPARIPQEWIAEHAPLTGKLLADAIANARIQAKACKAIAGGSDRYLAV